MLALLVIVVGAPPLAARGPTGAGQDEPRPVVVVGEGQTLWDLVVPHVPAGTDRAVYAAEVAAHNDLDPLRIPPGTVVHLP